MPTQQTVVLNFLDASGDPIANGRVDIQLQQDISAGTNGGPQVAAGRVVSAALDSTGTAVVNLWPTVGMSPSAVYFLRAFSSKGQPVWSGQITVGTETSFILLEDGTLIYLETGGPDAILTEVQ